MNLKKLNGWQRLGILLSAMWLSVVVVGAIVFIFAETDRLTRHQGSSRAEVQSEWAFNSIQTVWDAPSQQPDPSFGFVPSADQSSALEAVRNKYGDLDDVTFVERYQTSYPDVNFGQVNTEYEQLLGELPIKYQQDRQRAVIRAVGYGFLVWIVPSAFVFFLGRAVAWVWHGFKLKGESNE